MAKDHVRTVVIRGLERLTLLSQPEQGEEIMQGSCLCGRVQYQYSGDIDEISMCHCSQCRKAQGTAFVAVAPIRSAEFEVIKGHDCLKEFRASPGKARVFCSECGSPLYSYRDDLPEVKRLRVGTLETEVQPDRQYHAFVGSRASWYETNGHYPEYEEKPAGRSS